MERMIAQVIEIVKRKYLKEIKDKNNLKIIEEAFKKFSDELIASSLKRYLENYDVELKLDKERKKIM